MIKHGHRKGKKSRDVLFNDTTDRNGCSTHKTLLVTIESNKETLGKGLQAHGKGPADQADY